MAEAIAVNATEVAQAKGSVSIIGDVKIPKEIMTLLEKQSKKLKMNIDIIPFKVSTDFTKYNLLPSKDSLRIHLPLEVPAFASTYAIDIYDKDASGETKLSFKTKFIYDEYTDIIFKNTPYSVLDSFTDKTESSASVNSMYCAFAIHNEICLLTDLLSENSDFKNNEFVRKEFINAIFTNYERTLAAGRLQERCLFDRRLLTSYMNFMKVLKNNTKSMLRTKMGRLEEDMLTHYRAINSIEKQLQEATSFYASIARKLSSNKQDTDPACVEKMMKPLLINGKYETFDFSSGGGMEIYGYTNMISITRNKKVYEIGKFKVIINLDGHVKLENRTRKYQDEYDHPHVHLANPCLGNIKETVGAMIKEFALLSLFDLLHEYLCTYVCDENFRPYIKLEIGWGGLTSDQMCESCNNPNDSCICEDEHCPECDETRENCTCRRCPADGTLMSDCNCSECDSWDSDAEHCTY